MFAAHEIADAIVRVEQPAAHSVAQAASVVSNENGTGVVAALLDEDTGDSTHVEVDAAPVEPRRRAGLQPAHLESRRLGSTRPARAMAVRHAPAAAARADVDQPVKKGPGRHDQGSTPETSHRPPSRGRRLDRPRRESRPALPKIQSILGSCPIVIGNPSNTAACRPGPAATRRPDRDFDSAA